MVIQYCVDYLCIVVGTCGRCVMRAISPESCPRCRCLAHCLPLKPLHDPRPCLGNQRSYVQVTAPTPPSCGSTASQSTRRRCRPTWRTRPTHRSRQRLSAAHISRGEKAPSTTPGPGRHLLTAQRNKCSARRRRTAVETKDGLSARHLHSSVLNRTSSPVTESNW